MIWTALDTPHQYGSRYQSGVWSIHHREAGFGAIAATLYRGEDEILTFTGTEGLQRAQRYAERLESGEAA